jgi:ketol-acid reductoisomerase
MLMTAKTWLDDEVNLGSIKDETIAVIGYGIQGRAQANNMKESGLKVIVGLRKNGNSWKLAQNDGHEVVEISDAAARADIIHIMVAPKGPGQRVRELYSEGFGTPSLVAVFQDYTKTAWNRVLAMAKGIGSTRPGVIQTTFKEEVETDWFGEQVDLCGGASALVMHAFETLVEAGYQPEVAYFECLHELKLIVDLIHKYGITGMYNRVSETARYGGLTRGPKIIDRDSKIKMINVLKDIQSGQFAEEWVGIYRKEGKNSFARYMKEIEDHPLEKIGKDIRKMMWPHES